MDTPVEIAVAILKRGNRVLVRPRAATDPVLGGTLEFPGGRVEAGETPGEAARREIAEETGLSAPPLAPYDIVVHRYPDRAVRLHFFLGDVVGDSPVATGGWRWEELGALARSPLPAPNRPIVLRLLRGAEGPSSQPRIR
ncbi:MAG: NUDIX domain-containing protein [Planctomycetes bacterium]|nr:NUDIX domain-containing protein [Planctomycetota bacterium]